ncbi:hypothetical protein HpMS199_12060 [Helicobacter pylori]
MVGLVKLLLLWYLQTNQNLKNYLLVLAKYLNNKYLNNKYLNNKYLNNKYLNNKYLNNKYLNNRDIWYCESAICDKKGTYNIEIEIIFIASNSDNPIDIDNKTKKLESCFRDTIKHPFYCPFTIGNYLILDNLKSCFVFQNDRPFNLKQYLLGLKEKLGFELMGIFYCENSNTHKIELIGNDSDFREVLLEFSENIPKAPNEIPQFLTNFKNSKITNEKISFSPPKDYPSLYEVYGYFKREVRDTFDRYLWHGYSKIPQEKRIAKIKEQMNEEIKINPSFCSYRVDSEQNRKINEIVEGLKRGKIIGKKIIANAFDLNASYCFITPDGLKNLKKRLFIDIINVINQKKRVALNHAQIDDIQYKEGVALDYALINDIKHNLLDNTFHFIFDIDLHLIDD